MTIAVDFDGTIVQHKYPEIGKELPFATATLRQLQKDLPDLKIILWTIRDGKLLDEAVQWCKDRNLEFYAVNSNYPEELPLQSNYGCRKVTADVYVDDRNLGGLPDWTTIYRRVLRHAGKDVPEAAPEKKGFFGRLFGKD